MTRIPADQLVLKIRLAESKQNSEVSDISTTNEAVTEGYVNDSPCSTKNTISERETPKETEARKVEISKRWFDPDMTRVWREQDCGAAS